MISSVGVFADLGHNGGWYTRDERKMRFECDAAAPGMGKKDIRSPTKSVIVFSDHELWERREYCIIYSGDSRV